MPRPAELHLSPQGGEGDDWETLCGVQRGDHGKGSVNDVEGKGPRRGDLLLVEVLWGAVQASSGDGRETAAVATTIVS
jgi:hypothetical protein